MQAVNNLGERVLNVTFQMVKDLQASRIQERLEFESLLCGFG